MRPISLYSIFILCLSLHLAYSQINSCTVSGSTFYDGYLDPFIYYANFQRSSNSYFSFPNPYLNLSPLNQTTISFWSKIPTLSTSGSSQTGSFIDCNDIISLRILNDTVTFEVAIHQNVFNTGQNGQLNVQYFKNNITQLQQWNNYAFVFNAGNQLMFLNGVLIGQQTLSITILSSTSSTCKIGNSMLNDNPLTGYIRHFYMSSGAWSSSMNISNMIHHKFLPSDSSILFYFQFSENFYSGEQYWYDPTVTYSYNSMSLSFSSEPEFVCYCPSVTPYFLNISSSISLSNINISSFSSNYSIDSNGLYFDFIYYAIKPLGSSTATQTLFTLTSYMVLSLTNNSNTLQASITGGTITGTATFNNWDFRYNAWTVVSMRLTKSFQQLSIDGAVVDYQKNVVSFNNKTSILQIASPSAMTFLLKNITIKNYRGNQVANIEFAKDSLSSQVKLSSGSSLSSYYTYNNQLCFSTSINSTSYWTGVNCKDNRQFPYLNTATSTTSKQQLKQSLFSSYSNMTIQMWLKDMNSLASKSIIFFENTLDGTNPLIQMSVLTGTTTNKTRTYYCSPQILVYPKNNISISGVSSYGNWIHFSCISNIYANSVTAILHKPPASATSDTTGSISSINFYQLTSPIQTSIGSNVGDTSQFQGFMRELRIWSMPLSAYQVSMYRYNIIDEINNGLSSYLLYYYMMSNSISLTSLIDSESNYANLIEQSTTANSITWTTDNYLVLCQPGLYYNDNCCQQFDISAATFKFAYSTSKNQMSIALDSTSVTYSLYSTLKANFSLSSVGNNFFYQPTVQYLTILQSYFTANRSTGFTVDTINIDPKVGSLTVQALIYSDYEPGTYITKSVTLTVTCPMLWLTVLSSLSTDSSQTVSYSSTELEPAISAQVSNTCYNSTSQSTYTLTMSSIAWSSNITTPKFAALFTISNDTLTATAVSSKTAISTQSAYYQKITAVQTYNNNKSSISNAVNLWFSALKITTAYSYNQESLTLVQGSALVLDLSSAAISPSSPSLSIVYTASCPSSVFYSTSDYNSYCLINSSSGIFNITNTSALYVVSDYPYYFQVNMNIQGTSIISKFLATVYFTKDGGSTNCPRVNIQSSFIFYINQTTTLQILPDPYLSCSSTTYQSSRVNWTVTDSLSGKQYSSLLSFGSQTVYRFANVTPAAMTSNSIVAGQIFNISVIFTLSNQQQVTATTQLVFSQNALQPVVVAYGQSGKALTGNEIGFLEEYFVLNASTSYDPDNRNATQFSYTWGCPSVVLAYYSCNAFISGSENQYFYMNAYQRNKIGFNYTTYTFSITMSSLQNLYKTPVTQTFNVTFDPPSVYDSTNNVIMATSCVTAMAEGGKIFNTGTTANPKALKYSINNYTESIFNIDTANAATCSQSSSTVSQQIMFVYVFSTGFFPGSLPMMRIFEQNTTVSGIQSTYSFQLNLSALFDLTNSNIAYSQYLQANIYYFTQRNGGSNTVYLTVDTFYIMRNKASLVAVLAQTAISLDKYSTLSLDASGSYDPDNLGLNYTYKWTCPNNTACSSLTSSVISLNSAFRTSSNMNSNSTQYQYSVQMSDGTRLSNIALAQVTVTMYNNYSSCVQVSFNTSDFNSYYQNTTIVLEYNQSQPIQLVMNISQNCDSTSLDTPTYKIIAPQSSTSITPWSIQSITPQIALLDSNSYMGKLTPGTNYTVQFTQTFSMGQDPLVKYSQIQQFYLQMSIPALRIIINAVKVFMFTSTQTQVTLYSNQSYDPMSLVYTINWSCPTYFGGVNCSSNKDMTLTYSVLSNYATQAGYQIANLLNMAHPFTLTLTSSDGLRVSNYTYYLFLSGPTSVFDSTTSYCGIYTSNNYGMVFFSFPTMFNFSCSDSTTLTSSLNSQYSITWSIQELANTNSYYQTTLSGSNYLYLYPYALNKLTTNVITVSATISSLGYTFKQAFPVFPNDIQLSQTNAQATLTGISTSSISASYYITYGAAYQMYLSGFASSYNYGIQSQLRMNRGSYDELALPMKPLNDKYQTIMYSSVMFANNVSYFVDFFDMNFNYLGSYNLTQNKLASSSKLMNWKQQEFEYLLYQITNKNISSYGRANATKANFEHDMYIIEMFSEVIYYNYINYMSGQTGDIRYNYTLSIFNFLINNFITMMTYYSTYSPYDAQSIIMLEKKAVQIMANLLESEMVELSDYNTVNSILSIINYIYPYYSMIELQGNDQRVFRQNCLQILTLLTDQVNLYFISNDEIQNQKYFINIINATFSQLISNKLSSTAVGSVVSTIEGTQNVQLLLLNTTSTSSMTIVNSLNSYEQVVVSNQNLLSATWGISILESTFSYQQNSSSVGNTILDINAYNQYSTLMDVDFTKTSSSRRKYVLNQIGKRQLDTTSTYVTYYLKIKDSILNNFQTNKTSSDGKYTTIYYPRCMYLDDTTQSWSSSGQTLAQFTNSTGVVKCQTTHLSTFTLDYQILSSPVISVINSTSENYFVYNYQIYYGVIGASIFIVLVLLIFSLKQFTQWDYNQAIMPPMGTKSYPMGSILSSVFLLYHPLISAFFSVRRANVNTHVTKINKMANFWTTFFAFSFVVLMINYWLYDYYYEPQWYNFIILGCFLSAGLLVCRMIFISISTAIYFAGSEPVQFAARGDSNYSQSQASKSSQIKTAINAGGTKKKQKGGKEVKAEEESLLSGSTMKKSGGGGSASGIGGVKKKKPASNSSISTKKVMKSKSKQIREKFQELEGGSSEEEQKKRGSPGKVKKTKSSVSKGKLKSNIDSLNQLEQLDKSPAKKKGKRPISKQKQFEAFNDNSPEQMQSQLQQQQIQGSVNRQRGALKKATTDQFMAYGGPTGINDTTSGGEMSHSKNFYNIKEMSSEKPKKKNRKMINETNLKVTKGAGDSPSRKFAGEVSDGEKKKKKKKGSGSKDKYQSQAALIGGGNIGQSQSATGGVNQLYSSQKNPQVSSFQEKSNIRKGRSKDKYSDDDDNFDNKLKSLAINNSSVGTSFNSQAQIGKGGKSKSKEKTMQMSNNKLGGLGNQSTHIETTNEKSNSKSKLNKKKLGAGSQLQMEQESVKSFKSDKKSVHSIGKQSNTNHNSNKPSSLEDTNSSHYTCGAIMILIIRILVLLGFMGVQYWLMTFLRNFDQMIDWLEIFCGAFVIQILVVDTVFNFLFALIFKCGGNGKCSQIFAAVLLGNGHRNCLNALEYELNNK